MTINQFIFIIPCISCSQNVASTFCEANFGRTKLMLYAKLMVHNIGAGQVLGDCLFDFKIIGHYQYQKKQL